MVKEVLSPFSAVNGGERFKGLDCVMSFTPDIHKDERGLFYEDYTPDGMAGTFDTMGWCKQINCSWSKENVFRGFHAQNANCCQGKLIECVKGSIYDIIIDMRENSESFGHSAGFVLDESNHRQLWVPRGFLHGFWSMKNDSVIMYKCDAEYSKVNSISVEPYSCLDTFFSSGSYAIDDIIILDALRRNRKLLLSEADKGGRSYSVFASEILEKYNNTGKHWYN